MTRDTELFSKYPKIFSQVGGSPRETCGELRGGGWIYCACDACESKRKEKS